MQVNNGEETLKKYDLKANDAILVEEKHESIYDHVREKYEITYVAGGAAQNAARAAQVSTLSCRIPDLLLTHTSMVIVCTAGELCCLCWIGRNGRFG